MGWDWTRWNGDGMGLDGMGLSHSNAWPGTASVEIKSGQKLFDHTQYFMFGSIMSKKKERNM
jgi:hypothetical protein